MDAVIAKTSYTLRNTASEKPGIPAIESPFRAARKMKSKRVSESWPGRRFAVPAGTFHTFRIESTGHRIRDPVTVKRTYWVAPEKIARFIAQHVTAKWGRDRFLTTDRTELVSFTPGR
jgi:hypothetical protein